MKAYVTGGSGFVGKSLIRRMIAEGHDVRALAISFNDAQTLSDLGAEVVIGDVNKIQSLGKSIEGCDVVIHLAAIMKLMGNYNDLYWVNVEGTKNMLNAAREAGIGRFIHMSAGAVLTGGRPVIDADETWEVPEKPIGAYAQTKALGEKLVLDANHKDFKTIVLRPPCIWGAGDQAMLPGMVDAVQKGQWVWVDQGSYPYSTCHVNNVCEAMLLTCEKGQGGETYFIADGAPATFRDFFSELIRTQGLEPGNISIPGWTARLLAPLMERIWSALNLKGYPLISRETVALFLSPICVIDKKARAGLGYQGRYTRQQGMADLRKACCSN